MRRFMTRALLVLAVVPIFGTVTLSRGTTQEPDPGWHFMLQQAEKKSRAGEVVASGDQWRVVWR